MVGHPNQLRQRAGVHLLHHLRPVHFDRLLRNPELGGDLLVEEAGHDEPHHLALARRQIVEAPAKARRL